MGNMTMEESNSEDENDALVGTEEEVHGDDDND